MPGGAPGAEPEGAVSDLEETARRRGEQAQEALVRSHRVLEAYLKRMDPVTRLLPRSGRSPTWYVQDSAADLYPFLVLAAHFTDRPVLEGEMREILRQEMRLSTRMGMLSDNVLPGGRGFEHESADRDRIIFGSCEYAKDGLLPVTELLGETGWYHRLVSIADDIIRLAPYETDFGRIPSLSAEVNGELLQVLARLAHRTGDSRYIRQAIAIGDFYFREVMPGSGGLPAHRWDLEGRKPASARFSFVDHGNEIIGGLAELVLYTKERSHPRYDEYREPFSRLIHTILDCGLNEDGVWISSVSLPDRRVADRRHAHCWGYLFNGVYTAYLVTGEERFLAATRRALKAVTQKPTYLDDPEGSGRGYGSNAYSDAIESAIVLLRRLPDSRAFSVLDECVARFLRRQRPDGIIEDWYGDGNYVRTALMYALLKSQGTWVEPWREDLRLGAMRDGEGLLLSLDSKRPWRGRLHFDLPRHRLHWNLPLDYPRLNEFPEWYTVEPARLYAVRAPEIALDETRSGWELFRGLEIGIPDDATLTLRVTALAGPP